MSDINIPPPLGYVPDPLRPQRVVIEFNVLARSQAEADHMVNEVLIEELAGPPDQLRTDGDRVFGEDFGEDVASIRSWVPGPEASASPRVVAVPSPEWEPFEDSGIPEIVAEMFPPEPHQRDHMSANGTVDLDSLADAFQQWRDNCLSLAVQASRLPEIMERLERAERVHDGLVDLVEREQLPVEPMKDDYLVTIAPSFDGEYEGARFAWDHTQWRTDFTDLALRREHTLCQAPGLLEALLDPFHLSDGGQA